MKKKSATTTKASKKNSNTKVKDLKPRKSPKGGISLITPAVQSAQYSGSTNRP